MLNSINYLFDNVSCRLKGMAGHGQCALPAPTWNAGSLAGCCTMARAHQGRQCAASGPWSRSSPKSAKNSVTWGGGRQYRVGHSTTVP